MNRLLSACAAGACLTALAAGPVLAASPLDGTWKTELSTLKRTKRPNVMLLSGGTFTCKSCIPPYSVPADGAFHPVKDHPGFDEESVKVVDANTVSEIDRQNGRVVDKETIALQPGGKTAKITFNSTMNAGAPPVTGEQTITRTAAAPAGAHALSGTWEAEAPKQMSDSGLTQTMKVQDGKLTLTTADGASYTAKLDGTPAPMKGDPSVDTVSLKLKGDRDLVETDSYKGKTVLIYHVTVSPDGKTASISAENKKFGTTTTMTARKV